MKTVKLHVAETAKHVRSWRRQSGAVIEKKGRKPLEAKFPQDISL